MKIKNLRDNALYIGYKGVKPGFTLQAGQTSKPLSPALAHHQRIKRDADNGIIELVFDDADRRFLGGTSTKKKEAPVEVPAEPTPAPEVEPEEVEEVVEVVEEEPVEEPEVVDEEPEEEVEEPEEEPEEEEEEEESGFSLPKPPSKMTKADWLKIGMDEPLNMQNELDPGMTKTVLREKVEARIAELGL